VVPGAAGTSGDRYARLVAAKMSESLKQPVVVDNRPGAAGNIAADLVAKAPADGYTLLLGTPSIFGINPHLYKSLTFDAIKDFVAIAPIVRGYMYLFVPAQSEVQSLPHFVELARKRPGTFKYGSLGIGSTTHLAMEELKHRASIDMIHVPYKGGTNDIVRDLIAQEIDAAFDFYTPVMAQVKAGRLRALAITSLIRNPAVPDIPTFAEHGFPGFEYTGWAGLFAPAGTPDAIVRRLASEVQRARESDEVQRTIREAGALELKGSPEDLSAFVRAEYEKGGRLVKISGATIE